MLLNKKQLVQSLLQLVQGDYDLLSDMITDYVNRLDDADLDGLESYVNRNINELMYQPSTLYLNYYYVKLSRRIWSS